MPGFTLTDYRVEMSTLSARGALPKLFSSSPQWQHTKMAALCLCAGLSQGSKNQDSMQTALACSLQPYQGESRGRINFICLLHFLIARRLDTFFGWEQAAS